MVSAVIAHAHGTVCMCVCVCVCVSTGTGYSSEALNFILSMVRAGSVNESDVWISHHGDKYVLNTGRCCTRGQATTVSSGVQRSVVAIC